MLNNRYFCAVRLCLQIYTTYRYAPTLFLNLNLSIIRKELTPTTKIFYKNDRYLSLSIFQYF